MTQTTNRTVIVLIMMMLTTMTAWANDAVTYIDMDGKTKTVTEYTEVSTDMNLNWSTGTYVVKSSVTLNGCIRYSGKVIDLIVCDGDTLIVNGNEGNGAFDGNTLNIYAQSNGTGMGVVNVKKDTRCNHLNIAGGKVTLDADGKSYGLYVFSGDACGLTVNGGDVTIQNSDGSQGAIYFAGNGFVTLNGGKLTVTNSMEDGYTAIEGQDTNTINFNGGTAVINGSIDFIKNINLNSGNVTVNGEVYSSLGYTVTYDFTRATDSYYINAFSNDLDEDETRTVQVKDGAAFLCDGKSYSGTLSNKQISAISGKRMTPDLSDDFSWSGDTYTIHTAKGWGYFCDAMEDNDWNNFEGMIIQLGANIVETPVTRMAGSENHPFRGTFDGQNNTLNVRYGNSVDDYLMQDNAAPFAYVGNGCVIKNLHTTGSIYTIRNRAAGIVAMQNGGSTVTISNCSSNVYILSIGGENDGPRCHGGLVAYQEYSDNTILTIDNCKFYGKICTTGSPYTTGCGGLVGFKGDASTLTIKNCLYAPAALSEGESEPNEGCATLARRTEDHNLTIIDSYYTRDLSDPQGAQVYTTEEVNGALAGGTHDCYVKVYSFGGTDYYANTVITLSGLKTKMKTGTEYSLVVKEGETTLSYGSGTDEGDYGPVLYAPASGGSTTDVFPTTVGDYTVTVNLKGNYRGVITMDFELMDSWPFSGDGTEQAPYIITNISDLDFFVTIISEGTDADKYYKLADSWDNTDNPLTRMAGTADYKFCGHFDGNGKTLYVSYGTEARFFIEDNAAPFRYTDGATIQNLHVAGTIYIDVKQAAGIIANHYGTGTISNCRSSVNIISRTWGACNHGGLVGMVADNSSASLTIEGCVFDGKILNMGNTTQCGGLVGFKSASATLTITNSIYAPAALSEGETEPTTNCATLSCPADGTYTFTNCFYTRTLGTAQGYDYSFDHHYDAPKNFGTAGTPYSVSNITPYTRGILYGGKYYKAPEAISLIDEAKNNLDSIHGYFADVTLSGRKIYKDGDWNTFCVPFDVKVAGSPLEGATIMKFDGANSELINGTLTLRFVDVTESIDAGTPYIVKWDDYSVVENPVFKGVTISKYLLPAETTDRKVTFMGCYDYQRFNSEDQSILFLGEYNNLYWPTEGASIGACRAYFQLNSGEMAREFKLNFGEETTGVSLTPDPSIPSEARPPVAFPTGEGRSAAYYTLDGRRLSGKPTQKGIYINNGKKVIK